MLTELHCHSYYSRGTKVIVEGINSPEDIFKTAKKLGIEAVAITDHNSFKSYAEAKKHAKKYSIFAIPGEEISAKQGHILAIGITEEIKPWQSVEQTLDIIHNQGGIGIASHPFDIGYYGIGEKAKKCDAIEGFNSISLERISNWKARRFASKHRKPITAGSDAHTIEMLGNGLNNLDAEKDIDSIIKAIKKGNNKLVGKYATITSLRKWAIARLKLSYDHTSNYIEKNYTGPKKAISIKMLSLVKKSPGKIDYAFQALACIGIGSSMLYKAAKEIIGK